MPIKLSVIIPAYNEERSLKHNVLDQVEDYLKKSDYSYEVIIVDDGSADRTAEIIKQQIKNKKSFRLIENPHAGKAVTVMTGLLKADGEIALFTDMDQSTPLSEVEKFFPKFNQGFDIVIGSRHGRKGATLMRKFTAWGFATTRNIILGLPFSDTQCGFKAFNRKSRQEIFAKMMTWWGNTKAQGHTVNAGFDSEMLYLARKAGYKIAEVPVEWEYVGTVQYGLIKNSLDAVKDMLRVRLNQLQGKYN